jgi:hypothetical protein
MALFLASCGCRSVENAQAESTRMMNVLHEDINAGDINSIYSGADEGFRQGTTSSDSAQLFIAIRKKLGDAGKTYPQNTTISATLSGHYITATYETDFVNDPNAIERVVWHESDGAYRLYRYDINSNAFLR